MEMRRIKRTVAGVVAGLLGLVVGPAIAAQPAQAATPSIVVEAATIMPYAQSDLFINGYATCSEPTGQAQITVFAIQLNGNYPSGEATTTIDCNSQYGAWGVTVSTGHYLIGWHSGYLVFGNAQLIRNGVSEAMSCICVAAA